MNKKTDLMHKPNKTIMVSNGEITPTQRKAYNIILQKAWYELRLNNNQILFNIDITELKEKAGIESKDDNRLKNDIKKLRHIDIETVKENGDWSIFSLISQAERKGNVLEVELPQKIRQALIENDYYTTLDLLILKTLKGKYAIILYEIAIRYKKTQIPEMTVDELRELTGTETKKSYGDFGVLKQKILSPAIDEINKKTDINLSYTETQKKGKKVLAIKFNIKFKNKDNNPSLQILNQHNQINIFIHELALKFKNNFGFDISLNELNNLVENHGEERVECVIRNLHNSLPFQPTKEVIYNYFRKAVATKSWDLEIKAPKIPQHNFEQRTYTESEYEKFYSNNKNAD